MCNYLHGPRQGGMYYFRMGIPEPLRPIIGKREFFFSLKTKDRETAKRLILQVEAPRHSALLEQAAELARRQHAAPALADRVPQLSQAEMILREEQRKQEERAARIKSQEEEARLLRIKITGETEQMHPADAVIARAIRDAEADSAMWRSIAERAVRSMQSGSAGTAADFPPVLGNPGSGAASQKPPVSLTELFDDYAKVRNLTPAIAKEWRTGIDRFVAFVGHDDARRVTQADVLRWRNHARDEPQRNGKPRSPQRINAGYLAPLRGAFKHGLSEMLIEHNPAAAVPKLHVPKVVETRDRMFTREERKTILSAALTAGADTTSHYRGLARRWVPWLCAYSGARVNEMTQLRAEDVQQVEGHWIIQITPDAGRVKSKTLRNVPVHEHLIAQGFLEMVKAQGPGPLFYDAEKGEADSERGQYKKVGERLAAWVRSIGITDPGIMPNHAWRHTFKSLAMDAGIDERASDYITGHASVGVGRRIYTHHSYGPLAKQMAKLPRYDLGCEGEETG